jgi:hypothetical protein
MEVIPPRRSRDLKVLDEMRQEGAMRFGDFYLHDKLCRKQVNCKAEMFA